MAMHGVPHTQLAHATCESLDRQCAAKCAVARVMFDVGAYHTAACASGPPTTLGIAKRRKALCRKIEAMPRESRSVVPRFHPRLKLA
jgi:hypothetical protein